jgi:hypothetical protein
MLKLLENFWLKVLAVIMGLFVWFHVATEKTYNYELSLPVLQIDLQEGFALAGNPPESLLVTVSASGKRLLRQDWREEGLRINLIRYEAGTHQVTLNSDNTLLRETSTSITLDGIVFPNEVELHIDTLGQITVPVVANVRAAPDEGFAVTRPFMIIPDEVTLHGPRSLLGEFSSVSTELTELSGVRDNITLELPLVASSSYGVWLAPDSVTVTLEVVPVKTRVFEDLTVVVYNVPPRHTFITEPPSVTIDLTGAPSEIDRLDRSNLTVSADYRQANEYGMTHITVAFPSNFSIRHQSARTVKIILEPDVDPGN